MLLSGCMWLVGAAALAIADVLVVGGSGRVGGSTVRWMHELSKREGAPLRIAVGGRSKASFASLQRRLVRAGGPQVDFLSIDVDGPKEQLVDAVERHKLVVHTAGPFQGRSDPALLSAAIGAGVPYCAIRGAGE